jgi:hypothetical protein
MVGWVGLGLFGLGWLDWTGLVGWAGLYCDGQGWNRMGWLGRIGLEWTRLAELDFVRLGWTLLGLAGLC